MQSVNQKHGYMFPGQGAFGPGFGQEHLDSTEFCETLREASDAISENVPELAWGRSTSLLLKNNSLLQVTQLAVHVGIARMLSARKGRPALVLGHSLGELCALAYAGVFSIHEACTIVFQRGRLMQGASKDTPQDMLAVKTERHDWLASILPPRVWLSNINCPDQVVVAGDLGQLRELAVTLRSQHKIGATLLCTGIACHSPLLESANAELRTVIRDVSLAPPQTSFFCVGAQKVLQSVSEIRSNLERHLIQPVRWLQTLRTLETSPWRAFVEIGRRSILRNFALKTTSVLSVVNLRTFLQEGSARA